MDVYVGPRHVLASLVETPAVLLNASEELTILIHVGNVRLLAAPLNADPSGIAEKWACLHVDSQESKPDKIISNLPELLVQIWQIIGQDVSVYVKFHFDRNSK